jgi:two-component system NtrC family sensor kinase
MNQDILKRASELAHKMDAKPDQMAALFADLVDLAQQQVAEIETVRSERDKADRNLKVSQAQLVQSGKMAAVGQLAAGVAHEVNNPLQIILSRVQLLMMRNQGQDTLVQDLQLIEANVKRISRIIRSLLDFARHNNGEEDWKVVALIPLIEQTAELMRHLMEKSGIALTVTNLAGESPILYGNVGEIEQVFLNLLINALQATPKNGRIDICAECVGEYVVVRVSDTGKGIAPENLSRIFEPFFTTRENQGGTGLGLAIISGIVDKHRGKIEVESVEGEGTTFILTFPVDKSG